jgi:Immunoglobulin-like domain of bacterial spore germination
VRHLLLPALACAAALLLVACNSGDGVDITPGATVSPGLGDGSPTPTAAPSVCQPNPDPAPAGVAVVDSPAAGDSVTSPVTVSGRFLAFEAQFNITIFDAAGAKIVDAPAHSEEGQVLSPFSLDVPFSVTVATPACIWVYDLSAADGSIIDVVQIPVTLEPGGEPRICQTNPDPATPEFQVIDEPHAGDTVTSPVTISGRIVANEATFNVTIYYVSGGMAADTSGMNEQKEPGELAPFSIDVPFTAVVETPACIWVYELSALDGSPIHVGQIPVTLSP